MDAGRLPGTSGPEQIVAHVDMDCFYAACEQRREPALSGEPLVVGMGYENGATHGAVATASYEARAYGVESAMAISEALERLPRKVEAVEDPDLDVEDAGFYRPVDMDFYESVAADVRNILHTEADVVREVSIDEAYLDVTERVSWETVESWARDLKDTIESAVGVVASVGVAPTMSAAKVASDRDKPDGLVIVEPGTVRGFFADLPVEDVHGVGPVTARELDSLDVGTAGDLAAADPELLAERFGERGREIRRYARGEDERSVTPKGDPKSLSRESAFTDATTDMETKCRQVRTLADAVADRAQRKGARYQTIGIKVVTPPFDVNTRARSLPGPVEEPELVRRIALDLLGEFADDPVRKVGVRVSNLDFSAGEQANLDGFGSDSGTEEKSDSSVADNSSETANEQDGDGQVGLGTFGENDGGSEAAEDTGGEGTDASESQVSLPPGQTTLADF
ncbi:DNA polymerase IV [Haloarcula argentinensis]|uniref:DNA polymerase IV n=1 Tax=Haloarcula argentinensis TaxID=43776 RepID=A0A830FQP8_HALAR|nr:DNA polymerase IV [Haloarcula argentinensis]EMA23452.1 DNA polymerase IV [Haloarcula argentinensis DSM 12282]MDS0252943.1 DNA polymerase IV [Haloarcula argentinensis]GGM28270.1 DNA polymerase IV [Haloarcula argentinensis]